MEFLDTPNPNAKKILIDHNFEISINLEKNIVTNLSEINVLSNLNDVENIFTGPGFITVTKRNDSDWEKIIQDFTTNLDNI